MYPNRDKPFKFLIYFIWSVNFENLIVGLHILIISFMLAKFQKDQKSIAMSFIVTNNQRKRVM